MCRQKTKSNIIISYSKSKSYSSFVQKRDKRIYDVKRLLGWRKREKHVMLLIIQLIRLK